jgi:nitrogen-specific signal transduction histidine kinase
VPPVGNATSAAVPSSRARNTRATIERLQAVIEEQEQRIAQLVERLARYEDAERRPVKRPAPAIH